jgi:S-adenosylmethionine:tRNA ribosyltransferase-isomerase
MQTADFDFEMPPELIAQTPAKERDLSRLLVLHRDSGKIAHRRFRDLLDFLQTGDVLVLNNSRVIPARLRGANPKTGGRFEILLLEENALNDWWVMLRPGKRAPVGARIVLLEPDSRPTQIHATVLDTNAEGHRRVRFENTPNIQDDLARLGETPLPPYIERAEGLHEQDRERYQTVFAQSPGSVAAPTAGLHFTPSLLNELRARGVHVCFVTLHVGLGTFSPVKAEALNEHTMHEERFELSAETAQTILEAKRAGRRVFAVGTTAMRVLESAARRESGSHGPEDKTAFRLSAGAGRTRIFIYPPFQFAVADALLTNFHLPRSTLLMLVSAFAAPGQSRGRDLVLSAYAEAIRERYSFFSYGDAMLIL